MEELKITTTVKIPEGMEVTDADKRWVEREVATRMRQKLQEQYAPNYLHQGQPYATN